MVALVLPIATLWIVGSAYHHSPTWLVSRNLQVEVASKGHAIILDGLLGTFISGGLKGILKGIALTASALVSCYALLMSSKTSNECFHYGSAVALACCFLFVILNHGEIWAAVRFSRLLAILLAAIAHTGSPGKRISAWGWREVGVVLFLLFLTQFAFAWYMARVYFR